VFAHESLVEQEGVSIRRYRRSSLVHKNLPTLVVQRFRPQLNTVSLEDLSGLHLTDEIIFPHYGREDVFPGDSSIEERLQTFEAQFRCHVTRLKDSEALLINGNEKRKV
jgi:peptidase E